MRQFVDFLNYKDHRTPSPFLVASDEFDRQPEFLRLLGTVTFYPTIDELSPCTPV